MLWRSIKIVGTLINVAVWVVAIYFLFSRSAHQRWFGFPSVGEGPSVEYKDFVSILLTVLAVMIGVAAFIVALVAIWGIAEGRKMLESIARDIAEQAAIKRVNDLVPRMVDEALAFDQSQPDVEESNGNRIAEAYRDDQE
jgi:hypothetical protein